MSLAGCERATAGYGTAGLSTFGLSLKPRWRAGATGMSVDILLHGCLQTVGAQQGHGIEQIGERAQLPQASPIDASTSFQSLSWSPFSRPFGLSPINVRLAATEVLGRGIVQFLGDALTLFLLKRYQPFGEFPGFALEHLAR